ncbi:hypothetical protein G9A89_001006 [Geosiphon pyriformis]|nr:hypothetical protein G9A89_001006 [Geosiphon pyriformis]
MSINISWLQFESSSLIKASLVNLPNEVIEMVLENLEVQGQKSLSFTCRKLYRVVRIHHFGLVSPVWKEAPEFNSGVCPSIKNYREGILINKTFYFLDLTIRQPICWILDLNEPRPNWLPKTINILSGQHEPIQNAAVTSIEQKIYFFGGENVQTRKLENVLYELNIETMNLSKILSFDKELVSRYRHSLNAIDNRRLALFGGISDINGTKYDIRDFLIYDIILKKCVTNSPSSDLPYPRSFHSSTVAFDKLYIFGGKQTIPGSDFPKINDDEDLWVYDVNKDKWKKYISPSYQNFPFGLPDNWIQTFGEGFDPGRCYGAAMFSIQNKIAFLGGLNGQNNQAYENQEPCQYLKLFSPLQKKWEQVRVRGMPRMECIATVCRDLRCGQTEIFIVGQKLNEDKTIFGWIRD